MIMMVRDRTYKELRDSLEGKRVAVWTCNTCARFSRVGGSEAAGRLAEALRKDGVDAVFAGGTSASCIESKVAGRMSLTNDPDIILSLTCDVGAHCAGRVYGIKVLNPIHTIGPGYIAEDGGLIVCTPDGSGGLRDTTLDEEAERLGLYSSPFV